MLPSNACECVKCKRLISYKERISIKTYKFIPDPQCSGSRSRTIDNFSLCRECYQKYTEYTLNFFNQVSSISETVKGD